MMQPLNRLQMAWRAAQDIREGMLVNLGIGMPVAVADYLEPDLDVFFQSENGVIGVGPLATVEHADSDLLFEIENDVLVVAIPEHSYDAAELDELVENAATIAARVAGAHAESAVS